MLGFNHENHIKILYEIQPFSLRRSLGPANTIAPDGVRVVDLLRLPGVVGVRVGEHGDGTVARPAH